jgi:hypothetical protein
VAGWQLAFIFTRQSSIPIAFGELASGYPHPCTWSQKAFITNHTLK